MTMSNFTAIGTYVLVLSVLTVLVMVLVVRQQRSKTDFPIWLLASITGILLGAGLSAAIVQGMGYELTETEKEVEGGVPPANAEAQRPLGAPGPGGPSSGGPGGGG